MFTLYVSCENLHHSLPKELFYNFQLQICLIFHPTLKSFVQRAWWTIQRKKICEMICELCILPAREWIAMYMYSSAFSWMLCPDRIYFSSFSTGREWIFLLIYSFTFYLECSIPCLIEYILPDFPLVLPIWWDGANKITTQSPHRASQ